MIAGLMIVGLQLGCKATAAGNRWQRGKEVGISSAIFGRKALTLLRNSRCENQAFPAMPG